MENNLKDILIIGAGLGRNGKYFIGGTYWKTICSET
jgi:hypothetical protein